MYKAKRKATVLDKICVYLTLMLGVVMILFNLFSYYPVIINSEKTEGTLK